tara:strand:- start:1553 stop:2551 length:999 start_codon:yes stop_codon:yes gene_type:complete
MVFIFNFQMNELLIVEFFTSQSSIDYTKEKKIFNEALKLVDAICSDFSENPEIKKLHIIRNTNLKKIKLKKIKYYNTTKRKNLDSFLKTFPKDIPTIMLAPESDKISIDLYINLRKQLNLQHSKLNSLRTFSSKLETSKKLASLNIPTVECRDLRKMNKMPFISKPIFGAGSEMIRILKKNNFEVDKGFVYQKYHRGQKASFSMLCFKGKCKLISCNSQILSMDNDEIHQIGSIVGGMEKYRKVFTELANKVSKNFKGLYGLIGVDIVKNKKGWKIVEINTRFTSSFIGLRSAYGKNVINLISNFYISKKKNLRAEIKLLKQVKVIFNGKKN